MRGKNLRQPIMLRLRLFQIEIRAGGAQGECLEEVAVRVALSLVTGSMHEGAFERSYFVAHVRFAHGCPSFPFRLRAG